jgi:hypothetical protein
LEDFAGQPQKQKEPAGKSREHHEHQGFETVQPPKYPRLAGPLIVHARLPAWIVSISSHPVAAEMYHRPKRHGNGKSAACETVWFSGKTDDIHFWARAGNRRIIAVRDIFE